MTLVICNKKHYIYEYEYINLSLSVSQLPLNSVYRELKRLRLLQLHQTLEQDLPSRRTPCLRRRARAQHALQAEADGDEQHQEGEDDGRRSLALS